MNRITGSLILLVSFITLSGNSQPVDSIKFFTDEKIIEMDLSTDIRSLQNQKGQDQFQDAMVTLKFPDSTTITEKIQVGARGINRRDICRIPPIMMNFRNPTSPRLNKLGKLKLVLGCGTRSADEDLLLKEFLIYKIYNMIEDKSFRVRLLNVNYSDTRDKNKPFTQYAFLIEDDADMARRNGCKKKDHGQYLTEATDRYTMTKVAIFQYFIGNTDWAVPNGHNIKLIFDKKNENTLPYVIPYDFDYSGLVNASYAVPNEIIGTEKVTERVYRGYPRSIDEVQEVLDIFRKKKDDIYALINNFDKLSERSRKEMTRYIDEFYTEISNERSVRTIFIDNARKD
jgi:hypothetical protein